MSKTKRDRPRWGLFRDGQLVREFVTPWSIWPYIERIQQAPIIWEGDEGECWNPNMDLTGFDHEHDWMLQLLGKHRHTYAQDPTFYTDRVCWRSQAKGFSDTSNTPWVH